MKQNLQLPVVTIIYMVVKKGHSIGQ